MHVLLGADGHVGSALARALLAQGEPVRVILHKPRHIAAWRRLGAVAEVVDALDPVALQAHLGDGDTLFLLNPPAPPASDTDAVERASVARLLEAIRGTRLARVVAESTYGAQAGAHIGDLGVLHELEQGLAAQPIPATVLRAAFYMSNWNASLQTARDEGWIQTLLPADLKIAMVAPADVGEVAARLLVGPCDGPGPVHVEGPHRVSANDVARAFAHALGTPVHARAVPESGWVEALRAQGFSASAAASFAAMTAIARDRAYPEPHAPERGTTPIETYIAALVRDPAGSPG